MRSLNLSELMVLRSEFFTNFKAKKDRSHEHEETGMVSSSV